VHVSATWLRQRWAMVGWKLHVLPNLSDIYVVLYLTVFG
jgi:hypothetical protein